MLMVLPVVVPGSATWGTDVDGGAAWWMVLCCQLNDADQECYPTVQLHGAALRCCSMNDAVLTKSDVCEVASWRVSCRQKTRPGAQARGPCC